MSLKFGRLLYFCNASVAFFNLVIKEKPYGSYILNDISVVLVAVPEEAADVEVVIFKSSIK